MHLFIIRRKLWTILQKCKRQPLSFRDSLFQNTVMTKKRLASFYNSQVLFGLLVQLIQYLKYTRYVYGNLRFRNHISKLRKWRLLLCFLLTILGRL